jgi:hypothetical protein
MRKNLLLLALFGLLGGGACDIIDNINSIDTGNSGNSDSDGVFTNQKGVMLNYGEPAFDGCGWVIKVGEAVLSPAELLPEDVRIDGLTVLFSYRIVSPTSWCAWTEWDRPTIEVLDIAIIP